MIRTSIGLSVILLAIMLGASLFFHPAHGAEKISLDEKNLSEPALNQLTELMDLVIEFTRDMKELALPSPLEEREEIEVLAELYAVKYGVRSDLIEEIVLCESTNNPMAVGKEEERGLGQFMYGTFMSSPFRTYGWDSSFHPAVNIEAIAWMLQEERVSEFHAIPCDK
ncbi:transglycosylase SLT domain-containing protein [Patescibacteria group bacterium]